MNNNVIFIRSMRFFGGQLVTYPLLYQLKKCFPDDPITVVADDPVGSYYTCTPWVDQFVMARPLGKKLEVLRRQAKRVFTLHYSSEKYALLSTLCRVSSRVGFKNNRLSDFLWTHSYPKNYSEYLAVSNLQLLRRFVPFDIEATARASVVELARDANQDWPTYDVIMMPGGGAGSYKRWPIQSFLALADHLKLHLGPSTRFGFIMGPDEKKEAEDVRALKRDDFAVVMSAPVHDIAYLSVNARLIVANDCGPSHIAQNACVPYVSPLYQANPQWFWQRDESRCVLPNNGSNDITSISVERVFKACRQVLA